MNSEHARKTLYFSVKLLILCIVLSLGSCARGTYQTPEDRLKTVDERVIKLLADVRKTAGEGRYALGLQLADSLVSTAPELPESHYEKGLMLVELLQLDEADEELEKATSLDPYHRGAFYQRGHVAFQRRDYREAIRLYGLQKQVIESSPEFLKTYYRRTDQRALPQTWLQMGRAYELMQVADSARWAYENVLRLDSTHIQANVWLASLYKEAGDIDGARTFLHRAWKYDTGNPEVAYQLGMLLFESGAPEQAIPFLRHVVSVQPWHAGAHYNLGRILMSMGEEEAGIKHLALTDQLQDLEQAINYARAAVAQFPDQPARWRELATLLGRAGRKEEQQQTQRVIRALSQYVETDEVAAKK